MAEPFSYLNVVIPAATSLIVTGITVPFLNELTRSRDRKNEIYKALYAEKLKAATTISAMAASVMEAASALVRLEEEMKAAVYTNSDVMPSSELTQRLYVEKLNGLHQQIKASLSEQLDEVASLGHSLEDGSDEEKQMFTQYVQGLKLQVAMMNKSTFDPSVICTILPAVIPQFNVAPSAMLKTICMMHDLRRERLIKEAGDLYATREAYVKAGEEFLPVVKNFGSLNSAHEWLLGNDVASAGSAFQEAILEFIRTIDLPADQATERRAELHSAVHANLLTLSAALGKTTHTESASPLSRK